MAETQGGLLEWLAEQAGESYMSNLRHDIRLESVSQDLWTALETVELGHWSLEEWCDAASYLSGTDVKVGSVTEAVDLLKKLL